MAGLAGPAAGAEPVGPLHPDLAVSTDQPLIVPGAGGVQTVVVSNAGAVTRGASLVTFVTPAYTNIDHSAALPGGCSMRYTNPDPTVPEVVNCLIPAGIAKGASVRLPMPLAVTERARLTGTNLDLVSVVAAEGSPDREANINDNSSMGSVAVSRPTPATPKGNKVGLYLTHDVPVLAEDRTAEVTLTYGNTGPKAMRGPVQITLVTPFSTNIDRAEPMPDGCRFALADESIGTPEIVVCTLPALDADEESTRRAGAQPEKPRT
ncbi:hypothetical protein ACIO3O_12970 [Streptomyces sp. NPDC087440]|uniref:hypothetical protein n=1 Tax=Streptomyces sp. NPDC087440 TaxID=3365790 RepID=UPI003826F99F